MPVGLYAGANVSNGNGVTTLFPYNFKILDQTHIEVKVDGVVKALGADYAVTGVGLSNGGNVVFTVAPANGAVVQRARKVPYKRDTDYQANGDLREDTLDPDLDLEEMQIQQLAADIARAFKAPLSVTADQVLTDAQWAARALMMLGFDGAGNFGVFAGLNPLNPVSAYIATLLDDPDAATAAATLAVIAKAIGTTKGDIIGFTGNATPVRKGVGTDGYALQAQSGSADGLGYVPSAPFTLEGGYLDWTVAGNVLTVAIKTWAGADPSAADPVYVVFRDVTPATGSQVKRKVTAATSVSLNNTALIGTVNAVAFRLWCVAFDDAATVRLGLVNCLSTVAGAGAGRDVTAIYPLAGWGIASSTLSDNAADNAQTFYTGVAVAAKAYATLGYATWETGLAAAGVWSAAPTRKHLQRLGDPLPGDVIQTARADTGTMATGATPIPNDNTIPQSGEGDQQMAAPALAPSSAANVLGVDAQAYLSNSLNVTNMCLFQDATANALASTKVNAGAGDTPFFHRVCKKILAAGVAATTFKVRVGSPGGTTTINGVAGVAFYGGTYNSFIEVMEIMA
jgi:hypothetical protein